MAARLQLSPLAVQEADPMGVRKKFVWTVAALFAGLAAFLAVRQTLPDSRF